MAANSANITLQARADFLETGFGNFAPTAGNPIPVVFAGYNKTFSAGAGALQYNHCYAASLSVTSGTPLVLDLNGGTLKDPDGTVIVATDIVALLILNTTAGGGGTLTVGGGTNDVASIWGASGTEIILPGGLSLKAIAAAAGFTVTPSTAHDLQFVASAGTVTFDVFILMH